MKSLIKGDSKMNLICLIISEKISGLVADTDSSLVTGSEKNASVNYLKDKDVYLNYLKQKENNTQE